MAVSNTSKDRTVEALRSVWSNLDHLLTGFTDDQWRVQVPVPEWDVHATVAHVVGTEAMLLGHEPSTTVDGASMAHVHNPIGAMNENWIATYAGRPSAELLADFRRLTTERLAVLAAMSDAEWNAVGFTPAGQDSYGRFMRIRVFDCWCHEQDIRTAVSQPGHESGVAVEVTLDEMSGAMGFVVGKKAGAPAGSSVTFDLTGASGRQIHVEVGERAAVVPSLSGVATVVLTMPVVVFTRLAAGRLDGPELRRAVSVTGDQTLGQAVLDTMGYTI